jgi:hypothetical protein
MRLFTLLCGLVALTTGALFAQGGMMPGADNGSTVMLNTDKALFVFRNAALVKYDLPTLKPNLVLPLIPTPEAPAEGADGAARMKYYTELAKVRTPALLLAREKSLLLVMGDAFYRISQETLQIEAQADMKTPEAAGAPATTMMRATEPVPNYLLEGTTLYLVRSKELLTLNVMDGKIQSRQALPKELQPLQMGGFRGTRGGENGNRGGGQGGGGAAGGGAAGGGAAQPR